MKTVRIFFIITISLLISCNKDTSSHSTFATGEILIEQRSISKKVKVVRHDLVKDKHVKKVTRMPTKSYPCEVDSDVFILTYFFPDQTSECYTEEDLVLALVDAGEPAAEAIQRANTIFHTAFTSPSFLGEIAGIIGPSEFPLSSGNYSGSIWNMLNNGDCEDGCIPDPLPDGQDYSGCPPGDIERATHLRGKSGNLIFDAPNNSWIIIKSNCDPDFSEYIEFDVGDVQALLTTEQWSNLLLGNYTEREFWELYQYHVVPNLQQYQDAINTEIPNCYVMEVAGFRSNFYAFEEEAYGITICRILGRAKLYCGDLF